ncbi:unnamed protein product [Brachionus calyciflorus]|uniref:Uncharacterized protein n=1 Tax=Brachionus calyciflorus TaxID=104777 RepID=A0A814K274_9BILA|nr:unnamed protein product [Brachionus calyciflorus]
MAKKANLVEEFNNGDSDNDSKTEYVYTCSSGHLLCVSVYVNEHQIKFIVDSGCTSSIISSKFAKRNGLSLKDANINIRSANNSMCRVDGKTEILKVDIEGHVCNLDFLVIDHEGLLRLVYAYWCKLKPLFKVSKIS